MFFWGLETFDKLLMRVHSRDLDLTKLILICENLTDFVLKEEYKRIQSIEISTPKLNP